MALMRTDQMKEAIGAGMMATTLKPNDLLAWTALSQMYVEIGPDRRSRRRERQGAHPLAGRQGGEGLIPRPSFRRPPFSYSGCYRFCVPAWMIQQCCLAWRLQFNLCDLAFDPGSEATNLAVSFQCQTHPPPHCHRSQQAPCLLLPAVHDPGVVGGHGAGYSWKSQTLAVITCFFGVAGAVEYFRLLSPRTPSIGPSTARPDHLPGLLGGRHLACAQPARPSHPCGWIWRR